jgi:hypothetical protein
MPGGSVVPTTSGNAPPRFSLKAGHLSFDRLSGAFRKNLDFKEKAWPQFERRGG